MTGQLPHHRASGAAGLVRALGLALAIGLQTGGPVAAQVPQPPTPAPTPAREAPGVRPLEPLIVDDLSPAPPGMAPPTIGDGADSPFGPTLPELAPRKPAKDIASFVDSLSTLDAAFEVVVGQARILTVKEDIAGNDAQAVVAAGDPSVIEFTFVSPRQLRITGRRIGITELSITTASGRTYSFEVRVVADLSLLRGRLRALFPDASIRLGQIRDHVVVEGEARSDRQVTQILETIRAYLESIRVGQLREIQSQQGQGQGQGGLAGAAPGAVVPGAPAPGAAVPGVPVPDVAGVQPLPAVPPAGLVAPGGLLGGALGPLGGIASPELNPLSSVTGTIAPFQIINLLRVPGPKQVMLKVRVAELNRTALRTIGANFLGVDPDSGAIVGTQILGASGARSAISTPGFPGRFALIGDRPATAIDASRTVFGIFPDGNFEFTLAALRRNGFVKLLAEPNLVALSGHQASFLAGGEFPVPVPQVSAAGVAPTITVRFKEFGVRLGFVPYILEDGLIRLAVAPEVSTIDFTVGVTLVAGGSIVPGLSTRKSQTTVELQQGQTLAIAGLLQMELNGSTTRIPGLGDLPILGPFFSNTTGQRLEKELVVLVTPYLVEPMASSQVPPTPGDEVKGPNDLEFYLLNRIEGRTGDDFRATTNWDDPFHLIQHLKLEQKYIKGPCGFSD